MANGSMDRPEIVISEVVVSVGNLEAGFYVQYVGGPMLGPFPTEEAAREAVES
jgi:hypothetical protein